MNVSALQFYFFLVCISVGFIGGIFFLLFMPIKKLIKIKLVHFFIDIFCFILLTILYIFLNFRFGFPNIRFYMLLGVFAGLYIYFETLHIPLAKLLKTVYNRVVRRNKKGIDKYLLRDNFCNDRRKT